MSRAPGETGETPGLLHADRRSMRLLYIDDDRLNGFLFENLCGAVGGLEVVCAVSGAEALELAPDARPDLLVIDLHLPDTDGYALLPSLRAHLNQPELPALLCTADHPDDVRTAALAAGFQGCLEKPVSVESLTRLRDGKLRT